jgi:hypothetical protein
MRVARHSVNTPASNAGQRDLAGYPASAPRGRYTRRGLGVSACRVQCRRGSSLARRCGRFDPFQLGDALDQRGFLAGGIEHRQIIEHVFEYI